MIGLISIIGIILGLFGLGVAIYEARKARLNAKLAADLSALAAFLTAELAGRNRDSVIQGVLVLIQDLVRKQGGGDVLTEIDKLIQQP